MIHVRWVMLALMMVMAFLPLHPATSEDIYRLRLLPHQYQAFTAKQPFVAMVTGLGGGKTFTGARWTVTNAINHPETIGLVTMNSYAQSKDVVIPELERACEEFGVKYWWRARNQHPTLFIDVGHAIAEVRVRSTDRTHVDKIRGAEYGYWWGDEVRDATEYSVNLVMSRLRCTKVQQVRYLWTTTPNGFDHIYERHVTNATDKHLLIQATSDANTYLKGYGEYLAGIYDAEMLDQERSGKFIHVGVGQVYRSFDRSIHVTPCDYRPEFPLYVGCDFNVGKVCWSIGQKRGGGEFEWIDEVVGRTVYDAADKLADAYGNHTSGIKLFGDPSGHNRNHDGVTDYQMAEERLGQRGVYFEITASRNQIPVLDRVNSFNAMLRNGRGDIRMRFDPKAKWLIKDCEQVVWKDNATQINQPSGTDLTHMSDGASSLIYRYFKPDRFRSEPGYDPGRAA